MPFDTAVWTLENIFDSKSQKLKGEPCPYCKTDFNKLLGNVRSIIAVTKAWQQKTMTRWINPAPNHRKKK